MDNGKVKIKVCVTYGNESFECELPQSMYLSEQDLRRYIAGICDVESIMKVLAEDDWCVRHQLVYNPYASAEMIDVLAEEMLDNNMSGWNPQEVKTLLEHKLLSTEKFNKLAKICMKKYWEIQGLRG